MAKLITLLATAVAVNELAKHLAETPKESAAELIEMFNQNNQVAKELLEVKKENETLQALNDTYVEEIEKLSTAQPQAKVAALAKNFENEGTFYEFNFHSMTHKGNVITSDMVVVDTQLQNELIAMQSGMIYKA